MARRLAAELVPLADALEQRTAEGAGTLVERLADGKLRCLACAHRCVILPGLDGVCRVRSNREGALRVPRGYVAALQIDPIEKKPFFHALPGARALSFGMLGCDLHCSYCQNWVTSQTLRDPAAAGAPRDVAAGQLVATALAAACPVLVSTYNEPLITAEWAVEVFGTAKAAGLVCGFVSNGHATPEVIDYLAPYLDLYKVDLKGFRNEHYRDLGGRVAPVLDTIKRLHARGIWLEIVTLLIPGVNDAAGELEDLTSFVASVSADIPWHVTAFHPDYKMTGRRATSADDLLRAAAIGVGAGLRFVYCGNLPGAVGAFEDTRCPGCGTTLVSRRGYTTSVRALGAEGRCTACGTAVPGYWRGKTA